MQASFRRGQLAALLAEPCVSCAVDASLIEVPRFGEEPGGEGDKRQGEGGAAGFAQPQPQVEQRLEAEFGEQVLVGGFGGA